MGCVLTCLAQLTPQVFLASVIIIVYGSLKVAPHNDSLIAARAVSYPLFFGIAAYSVWNSLSPRPVLTSHDGQFEGVNLALSVENNMRKPELYKTLLNSCMAAVAALYISFALAGTSLLSAYLTLT